MKIKEIRTRVSRWRGKTVPLPPHFCTNPMDLLASARSHHGHVHLSRLADRRNLHRQRPRRHRQRRPCAARHQTGHRPLSQAAAPRRRPVGHRISLAAHVSQDHGVRPQRHRHGRHQRAWTSRSGTCSANPRSSRSIACSAAAPNRKFPSMPAGFTARRWSELAREAEAIQGRRLQGDEAALRLGTDRRRGRHAKKCRAGPHRARGGRRRHGHHGRRLHGLDPRLRQAHASAARTVQSALAGRTGHSRRHPRLRRTEIASDAFPSPAANTSSRSTASANCSKRARWTTSSSTPTASAASRRRAKSPRWPRRIPFPSFRTPARCTITTSSWPA